MTNWPSPSSIPGITDHQRSALSRAFQPHSRIAILTGSPGTGKTYVLGRVIRQMQREADTSGQHLLAAVAAPTGKAAIRASESLVAAGVDNVMSSTTHRLLGPQRNGHDGDGWGFFYNAGNHLPHDLIVPDEASMYGTDLGADLFSAIGHSTRLLLVGDPYQLPPVEHGAVLRDLIAAGVPHGELTECLRNGGDILRACYAIKAGRQFSPSMMAYGSGGMYGQQGHIDDSPEVGKNFGHFETRTPAETLKRLEDLFSRCPKSIDPVWDCQVLVALSSEKSGLSRVPVNECIQGLLNPTGEPIGKGTSFRVGDKVMNTKNGGFPLLNGAGEIVYAEPSEDELRGVSVFSGSGDGAKPVLEFVANGEIGRVLRASGDGKGMVVQIDSPPRSVLVPFTAKRELDGSTRDWQLAYAVSFHKSQGSQWPVVIPVIDDSSAARQVGCRELWYTGFSRPERLCLSVGQWGTMLRQCKRVSLAGRRTMLKERILEGIEGRAA